MFVNESLSRTVSRIVVQIQCQQIIKIYGKYRKTFDWSLKIPLIVHLLWFHSLIILLFGKTSICFNTMIVPLGIAVKFWICLRFSDSNWRRLIFIFLKHVFMYKSLKKNYSRKKKRYCIYCRHHKMFKLKWFFGLSSQIQEIIIFNIVTNNGQLLTINYTHPVYYGPWFTAKEYSIFDLSSILSNHNTSSQKSKELNSFIDNGL